MILSDVVIVLSRPAEAGNVGAVCRAMKNMGLSNLRLAAPLFDTSKQEYDSGAFQENSLSGAVPQDAVLSEAGFGYGGNLAVIKARAVHAADVWENAETFDSLSGAIADCSLVAGTTRRRGRRRKQVTMTATELALFLKNKPGKAALVFGNERTGLEDGELELCNIASHIPVDESFPSLNLSHAVQIYAYEIFMALGEPKEEAVKGQWVPLDQDAVGILSRDLCTSLKSLGFYKQVGLEEQERFFRDFISRAALTEREGRYFADTIAKAARLAKKAAGSTEFQ